MFDRIQEMVDDLTSTNSNNEKKERLKKYDDLKKVLEYTYNPFKKYNVTSKNVEKYSKTTKELNDFWSTAAEEEFFILLDRLSTREFSGNKALWFIDSFIHAHNEYKDLIYSIIDKNLKIRMSVSLINKVFPDLIPEFKCQLADKFDAKKVKFEKDDWYSSRKLDGVRCLTIVKDNGKNVECYSRTGNQFLTLKKIIKSIKSLNLKEDVVLDGEMCIVDKDGNEDFASMMKVINKKDYTIESPRYKIFDYIPLKDFFNKKGKELFSKRYENLKNNIEENDFLNIVEQVKIKDDKHFEELVKKANDFGWEGLIIRKDVPYAGKRSKDMLKVKKFHDAEYVVKATVAGPIRYINKGTGLEEEKTMLSSVVIEHKGNLVNVGSGFSIEQRQAFFKDPSLIIGKIITVKYFEESKDMKTGKPSLRFPVLKHIYEEKRDV